MRHFSVALCTRSLFIFFSAVRQKYLADRVTETDRVKPHDMTATDTATQKNILESVIWPQEYTSV